jgi:hypothetical protein
MRKPLFWRDVNLAIGAGGLASMVAAFRLPGVGDGALQVVLVFAGSAGLLIGICGTVICWAYSRTEAALRRGEGVMGRWRVDAAAWPGFLSLEKWMAAPKDAWPNVFTLPKGAETKSLDVIVGQEGVLIGDDVFRLPRRSTPQVTGAGLRAEPGTPTCVELWLYFPPTPNRFGTSPARRLVLRFPTSPTAEAEAARIVTYYHQGRPGEADFFHGRGDGSDPEDMSTCRSCGWQTHKFISVCEKCGGSMLSRRWARRFGGVLVVLGLVLTLGLGCLLWMLGPQLMNPGRSFGGTRFTGTPLQALGVFAILGGVFAFGATTMVYGVWQMSTGRRNMRVVYGMFGVIAAVVVIASALKFATTA